MTLLSRINLMSVEAVSKNKFDFKNDGLIVMPTGQTMAGNGILTVLVDRMDPKSGDGSDGSWKGPIKVMPDVIKEMLKFKTMTFHLVKIAFNQADVDVAEDVYDIKVEEIGWTLEDFPQVKGARPFCQIDFDLIEMAVKLLAKMTKGNKRMGMMGMTIGEKAVELTAWVEETNQAVIAQVKAFDVRERVGLVRRLK